MDQSGHLISSKRKLVLDLPPSCIEFCASHPAYFVVGTYDLVTDNRTATTTVSNDSTRSDRRQERNGSLVIFHLVNDEMRHVQTLHLPSAILDAHFCPTPNYQEILAVVSSTATLAIFRLDPTANPSKPLTHLATSTIPGVSEGSLFLSGIWSPSDPTLMAITTSAGEVYVVQLDRTWKISTGCYTSIITHSLEAWTVAFSPQIAAGVRPGSDPCVIYSGGDDSTLRYTSCAKTGTRDIDGEREAIFTSRFSPLKIERHHAGVTAILPAPFQLANGSSIVVTGSYDDSIRAFAIHAPHETHGLRKYHCLAEQALGGGVWRLKLVKAHCVDAWCRLFILASCMHAGVRIVELSGSLDGTDWKFSILARFEEHRSMNYSSDIVPMVHASGSQPLFVSTSFYDKLLCLWGFNIS